MNILIDAAVTFEKLKPNDKAYVMGYMQACLNKKSAIPGPETSVAPVALPETPVELSPVAVPEAVEPPSAPERSTYRLVLNVPELGLKGFAD